MTKQRWSKGMGLLEAVVGIAVIIGVVIGLVNIFHNLLAVADDSLESLQATFLLEEGAEVVRLWRDKSWDNLGDLAVGTDYFYDLNGNNWATSTTNIFLDSRYDRRFRLTTVNRDVTTRDIVSSGGGVDSNTKLVTVSVAWRQNNATTTKSVQFYLAKLF